MMELLLILAAVGDDDGASSFALLTLSLTLPADDGDCGLYFVSWLFSFSFLVLLLLNLLSIGVVRSP